MGEIQSFQEVSKIILEELVLNPIDFKKKDYQEYFYDLKKKEPENYERLTFDINRAEPYSEDLSRIFDNFLLCGFTDMNKNIVLSSLDKIRNYVDSKK